MHVILNAKNYICKQVMRTGKAWTQIDTILFTNSIIRNLGASKCALENYKNRCTLLQNLTPVSKILSNASECYAPCITVGVHCLDTLNPPARVDLGLCPAAQIRHFPRLLIHSHLPIWQTRVMCRFHIRKEFGNNSGTLQTRQGCMPSDACTCDTRFNNNSFILTIYRKIWNS